MPSTVRWRSRGTSIGSEDDHALEPLLLRRPSSAESPPPDKDDISSTGSNGASGYGRSDNVVALAVQNRPDTMEAATAPERKKVDGASARRARTGSDVAAARHVENVDNRNGLPTDLEDYPRGVAGLFRNRYVATCACLSALGGFLFGYDQGVVSVIIVMPQFLLRFPSIDSNVPGSGFSKGLLTAMIELGALFGSLNLGWIADRVSRRYSIALAVVVFIIGSALQTGATDYAMLAVARLIGGVGIGALSAVVPLYISEISPPSIRGSLLVLEEFSIVTGIVIAFWITYGTRYIQGEWAWRLPFLLQLFPGFVLGVGILFLPFSPRWLVSRGRDGDALAALSRLRKLPRDDRLVLKEWFEVRAEVAFHREVSAARHPKLQDGSRSSRARLELASWSDCFGPSCWRRTHVGVGLMFFQQFVGINALIYYSPSLFQTMGLDYDMQLIMSGVLNITQLVGVTSSIWTMDRLGRRPLLLWGAALMCVSHIVISGLVGKYQNNWASHTPEGWISVAFLLFYMLCFGASWGPVPWAMPSEIFPSSLRAKGVGLSTASNWLNNFIIGLITPPLVQNTGFGAYVFFAVFCLLALAWTYFYVPETMGRSLERMGAAFGDRSAQQEETRKVAIQAEISANWRIANATNPTAPVA